MNKDLASQRCAQHAEREAVARCPECRRFFCRECITEHAGRVLCAHCLQKLGRRPLLKRPGFVGAGRVLQVALGVFLAWLFFYLVGEALLGLPTAFHEGTLWQAK